MSCLQAPDAHGGIQKQMVISNMCAFVYQGGLGAEPSGGSERSAPTRCLGKTRTTAGKAACLCLCDSCCCFSIFSSPHCLFINSCCLVSPEGFDPTMIFFSSCFYSIGSVYILTELCLPVSLLVLESVCSATDLIPALHYTHDVSYTDE